MFNFLPSRTPRFYQPFGRIETDSRRRKGEEDPFLPFAMGQGVLSTPFTSGAGGGDGTGAGGVADAISIGDEIEEDEEQDEIVGPGIWNDSQSTVDASGGMVGPVAEPVLQDPTQEAPVLSSPPVIPQTTPQPSPQPEDTPWWEIWGGVMNPDAPAGTTRDDGAVYNEKTGEWEVYDPVTGGWEHVPQPPGAGADGSSGSSSNAGEGSSGEPVPVAPGYGGGTIYSDGSIRNDGFDIWGALSDAASGILGIPGIGGYTGVGDLSPAQQEYDNPVTGAAGATGPYDNIDSAGVMGDDSLFQPFIGASGGSAAFPTFGGYSLEGIDAVFNSDMRKISAYSSYVAGAGFSTEQDPDSPLIGTSYEGMGVYGGGAFGYGGPEELSIADQSLISSAFQNNAPFPSQLVKPGSDFDLSGNHAYYELPNAPSTVTFNDNGGYTTQISGGERTIMGKSVLQVYADDPAWGYVDPSALDDITQLSTTTTSTRTGPRRSGRR